MSTLTISIAGATVPIKEQSWKLPDKIEERSKCSFVVQDDNAIFSFKKGQLVTVTDTVQGVLFSGVIRKIKHTLQTGTSTSPVLHVIECEDKCRILDAKSSNKQYINQYAGAIVVDQIKDEWVNGITANFAIDVDDTQSDFSAGTLSGTVAASNVEDGNLELAPAGVVVTIVEDSTADFSTGSLQQVTASNGSIAPTAVSAIKIQATQSVAAIANPYTYVKIWSGSIGIISGRYLSYDVWIASSSPEIKAGVDLHFTDGTALRDNVVYNDAQNKSPHPGTDLSGLADGKWYHRKFLLDNLTSKTIDYVSVAIEGDKAGTYTAYFKNILEVDAGDSTINTFFSGTLNVNPPKQMQKQGYGTTSVTVVPTYDPTYSFRTSPAYNVDPVKILKDSFLSWKATEPDNTNVVVAYSLNGGNSYLRCVNNAPLPNLPAGLSLAGKTIQFVYEFEQEDGYSPESLVSVDRVELTLNPSYTASKSDVLLEGTTNGQWNAGTLSNTQVNNGALQLLGAVRYWDDADISSQTLFAGGATGPNNVNTTTHTANNKEYSMTVHQLTEGRSRLDFAGSWQNFIMEFDCYIDNSAMRVGCVYRTTGWSNYDDNYAYCLQIFGTTINLKRGSNSSQSSSGTSVQIATATVNLTSQATHHIKLVISGSSHQVYFDDTLAINVTDSTYSSAGNVGFRISNTDASNGYISRFDNFGITVTGLSGTWTSPSTSLTSAGTYLTSVVQWLDVSSDQTNTSILVESTINGGSSWQTVTNGGTIPNLTLGQSLSGISVQFRITLTTATAVALPQVQNFIARVLGGFSSSGTRISKALLLTAVGVCGSTLVFWNVVQPNGTSVAVATSLDGSSYTNVSNGGNIAGLLQQPAPTIDSFNLISSSSYTNTAKTGGTATVGWIWDTANSRLSVSGGTSALLLYTSISAKDVDIIFDLDQADQSGVVWRRTDNSNFYSLEIFDGSSSAGATNIIRLFKIVANVKTQIGADISITLARGLMVKRARVKMVGTAIDIYFDGSNVRSTTDSSLSSSGLCGFIEVSGIARFYNLRIQPIGDDLTNKKVYTRITLTSTDPSQTPQVTDFTTLVTNPDIQAGSLVPTADYRNTYKSDNINDLAKRSDYIWNILATGNFIFRERKTEPSPWVLAGDDTLIAGLEVEDSGDLYRNRHILRGVKDQLNVNQTFPGDSTSTSWTLQYNVVSVSSMALNSQPVTFGRKGIDSGKDFYYEVGSNSLAQDSSGTLLQKDVDALSISYVGDFETSVTRDNTGQFPGTISQKDYINQSGLSIPSLTVLNQASASQNASGSSDDLDVSLCRRIALDINVTAHSGTSPTVQFFLERKSADGSYTILYQSSVISASSAQVSRSIGPGCATKESLGGTVRLRWVIGGTSSPTKTFSASILAHVDPGLAGIGVVEAIEDVSGQNLTVAAAQALGDSRLQKYGVIGRTLKFGTRRTGLAAGQYLNCFAPQLGLNDATLLITSVDKTQKMLSSGNQDYWHQVEATESANLGSWQKAMNDMQKTGA